MKYLFIALVALGLFATFAMADVWENEWMRDAKINSEGVISRNILNTGGAAGTKTTLTECPNIIAHSFSSITVTVDTVVLPKGCCGSDGIWISQVFESEDSTYAATTDEAIMMWTTDTLFFEKSANGTGIDIVYAWRVR